MPPSTSRCKPVNLVWLCAAIRGWVCIESRDRTPNLLERWATASCDPVRSSPLQAVEQPHGRSIRRPEYGLLAGEKTSAGYSQRTRESIGIAAAIRGSFKAMTAILELRPMP